MVKNIQVSSISFQIIILGDFCALECPHMGSGLSYEYRRDTGISESVSRGVCHLFSAYLYKKDGRYERCGCCITAVRKRQDLDG
jgi:hypothetical protein